MSVYSRWDVYPSWYDEIDIMEEIEPLEPDYNQLYQLVYWDEVPLDELAEWEPVLPW